MPIATSDTKRPVRVAGASGGFSDRQRSIHDIAKYCDVDVIIGDWMSECTMSIHGTQKAASDKLVAEDPNSKPTGSFFDPCFMDTLTPALPVLQEKGVKVAVNAGASAPDDLAQLVSDRVAELQLNLKVAWVEGDNVTKQFEQMRKDGHNFANLDTGKALSDWGCDPICAQCYLGGMGIAAAFKAGADIVICGRVADASPCVGAAAWWHNWDTNRLDELAASLIAGHLIECSTYVTGGYYSGFKNLMDKCEDLGFPIASIGDDGEVLMTMEANKGGEISVGTVTSQLLYEIQGPLYYNSDVTADIRQLKLEQAGVNQVRMTGVKGLPAPSTTKVGVSAHGGYQAEFHFLFCGLDIKEKAEWTERQIRYGMRHVMDKFSCVKFQTVGACTENPKNQNEATVFFRIFVQTKDPDVMGGGGSMASMSGAQFQRWCMENFLQSCPGASVAPDLRTSSAKPIIEYWVSLIPQSVVEHKAILGWSGEVISIPSPKTTNTYPRQQESYNTTPSPTDLSTFGPTTSGPLGWVVMGRSGDKASDANVGFFVRQDDEYEWLRSMLSTDKFIELLGDEYLNHGVDRFEMPGIKSVHFLVHDHLDRGFNSTSSLDSLGKNLCEYLRARWVDIPNRFLERGKI